MNYNTPELLAVGSANSVVKGMFPDKQSLPNRELQHELGAGYVNIDEELW